jgi:hypothetical protein
VGGKPLSKDTINNEELIIKNEGFKIQENDIRDIAVQTPFGKFRTRRRFEPTRLQFTDYGLQFTVYGTLTLG